MEVQAVSRLNESLMGANPIVRVYMLMALPQLKFYFGKK